MIFRELPQAGSVDILESSTEPMSLLKKSLRVPLGSTLDRYGIRKQEIGGREQADGRRVAYTPH
jgi:hypothetical protein